VEQGRYGQIPREQIEQIRQSTEIVDLIGRYVQLKASGQNFMGLCPFHSEKTPSFVVSPIRQNYHCYGCGVHGDVIRFIIEVEHYHFLEAVRYLADRCGIQLQQEKKGWQAGDGQNDLRSCLQQSFDFFRNSLLDSTQGSSIRNYIQKRDLSPYLIETFAIGFAPSGWTTLHKRLKQKQISIEVQESTGLIKKGEKGNYYDRLRNRLIFPIRDIQGRTLGFSGRAIENEEPKYLNPPETELYKKSSAFYGVYEAKDAIRKRQSAILVEGYLDVMRLHDKGWKEAIASCGTAVNEEHIKVLKRLGISNVFLLFDGDAAGIKAAEKSARLFLEKNVDSQIIELPDGLDPDDYFKSYGPDDFQQLMDRAKRDYEFLLHQSRKRLVGQGFEHQKKVIQDLLALTHGIEDPIKKELFFSKAADEFEIELSTLKRSAETKKSRNIKLVESPNQVGFGFNFPDADSPEVELIQYLLAQVQSIEVVRKYLKPEDFEDPQLSKLYARFLQLSDEEFVLLTPQDFPELFVEFSDLIMHLLQTGKRSKTDSFDHQMVENKIYRLKLEKISRSLQQEVLNTEQFKLLTIEKQKLRKQFSHLKEGKNRTLPMRRRN